MEFKKQKTIYLQIADTLCDRIVQGEWKSGERFPSVREVAGDMGVNPNTVMRTFDYLQSLDIIYNKRGIGYFVADDASKMILDQQRKEFIEEELPLIIEKINMLGLDPMELFNTK